MILLLFWVSQGDSLAEVKSEEWLTCFGSLSGAADADDMEELDIGRSVHSDLAQESGK